MEGYKKLEGPILKKEMLGVWSCAWAAARNRDDLFFCHFIIR